MILNTNLPYKNNLTSKKEKRVSEAKCLIYCDNLFKNYTPRLNFKQLRRKPAIQSALYRVLKRERRAFPHKY